MPLFYRLQRKTCFDYISQLSPSLPGSARHTHPPSVELTAGGRSQGHSHGLKRVTHTAANLARNSGGLQVAEDLVSSRGSLTRQRVCAATQVQGPRQHHPPTSACLVPTDTQITGTIPPTETSLPALQSCFSTSETKGCLFLPLLSANFFAPDTPKAPQGSALRTVQAPAQPSPEAGGGTRGVKSQSKPASSFLTFAPDSQRQP